MKRKIKNWWNKYVTIVKAEIALCVAFGCMELCFGNIAAALIWLCCSFAWFCCYIVEQRYKYVCKYADAAKANNDELYGYAKKLNEQLEIIQAHHYFTFLQKRTYQNDVAFCKREKSCSEYISYRQHIEEAIAEADNCFRKLCAAYIDKYGEDEYLKLYKSWKKREY